MYLLLLLLTLLCQQHIENVALYELFPCVFKSALFSVLVTPLKVDILVCLKKKRILVLQAKSISHSFSALT